MELNQWLLCAVQLHIKSQIENALASGADIHAHHDIALKVALLENNNQEIVQFLLEHGANDEIAHHAAALSAVLHDDAAIVQKEYIYLSPEHCRDLRVLAFRFGKKEIIKCMTV